MAGYDGVDEAGNGSSNFSRRRFFEILGAAGGTTLAMAGMDALGFGSKPAYASIPKMEKGKTAKVVILGAGLAGLTSAYELSKMGYDVQIIEARSFAGGRSQSARKGTVIEEVTGSRQVCDFDDGHYLNTGPWRIPYHHHATLHYAREFNVPLEILVNDNDAAYVQFKNGKGPLAGKRLRKGEITTDMRGYTAELMVKVANQGGLDELMTAEDRDRFIEYMIRDGLLTAKDLKYTGTADRGLHSQAVGRGYSVMPGAGVDPGPGVSLPPYEMSDLLSSGAWKAVTNAANYEHPGTMFQPVGGMDMIAKGFEKNIGRLIKYSTVVEKIGQSPSGVTVEYQNSDGTKGKIDADYCICTIPLSVLSAIPMDVSPRFRQAMDSCPYAPVNKVGLQMKQRFWETKHDIYGGHVQTDAPGIGTISLPSGGWNSQKGVVLGMYSVFGQSIPASAKTPAERIQMAVDAGQEIFPEYRENFETGIAKSWHMDRYNLGGWANWSDEGRKVDYPVLCEPDQRIYLAGEHLSYIGGWQAGAIESAWQQAGNLHARVQQG